MPTTIASPSPSSTSGSPAPPIARGPGWELRPSGAGEAKPVFACSLAIASTAEVVQLLSGARRTGKLEVIGTAGTRSLYFEEGSYTGSSSTYEEDKLGQVLWRMGRISLDQLLIASEQVKEGKLLGRALVELGFLDARALREVLLEQARSVLAEAFLEEAGIAVFHTDEKHRSPLKFGFPTKELIDDAAGGVRKYRDTIAQLGDLGRKFRVSGDGSGAGLSESANAMWQLASSAKESLTGWALLEKAGAGRAVGVVALRQLVKAGVLSAIEQGTDHEERMRRLANAVNLVVSSLDELGNEHGKLVRAWLNNPPPAHEDALSGISLDEPLDPATVVAQAAFIPGGRQSMVLAMTALFDDAMVHAADALPGAVVERLRARLAPLLSP